MKVGIALIMGVAAILLPLSLLYLVFFVHWTSNTLTLLAWLVGLIFGSGGLWLAYVASKVFRKRLP
jgi:hypothetical protein